jgi:hypothetical protein
MAVLDRIWPSRNHFKVLTARGIALVLAMSAIGALMEWVQQSFGRSASWHDAMANALGITAAVFGYIGWRWHRCHPSRRHLSRALFCAAGCLLALAWFSPVLVLIDVVNVERNFPRLASFESPAEMGRFWFHDCRGSRTQSDATDGKYSLEVTYEQSKYPRFSLIEFHRDWSQAKALELDVRVVQATDAKVTFLVKVLDQARRDDDDTYRGSWTIEPGNVKRIRIDRTSLLAGPADRPLDLSQIDYVDFALVEPGERTTIRIDRIQLSL